MSSINTIIYDLGNVLVRWDPRFVFDENYFESEAKRVFFFDRICTAEWNEKQDEGRSIVDGTMELIAEFPEWEQPIRDYYGRWTEMLKGPIGDSVKLLEELKKSGRYKLYALTNWNAQLFEIALVRYDFLQLFDGIVVSGSEKLCKPDPRFYRVLFDRYGVNPWQALFIDDSEKNVKGAESVGLRSIHFENAMQLRRELRHLEIL